MDHLNQPKKGAKFKYRTRRHLRDRCFQYFQRISYVTVAKDAEGNELMNLEGEPIQVLAYAHPPTLESLCLFLGIDVDTWENYRKDPMFMDVCLDADTRIKAWRVEQTSIRDKTQGLQFLLTNYDNMRERMQVDVNATISMSERKEILRKAGKYLEEDMEE